MSIASGHGQAEFQEPLKFVLCIFGKIVGL
jgi:hypothetical protein